MVDSREGRWPAARAAQPVVTRDTTIVLEGFPGSAVGFAREAIRFSNPHAAVATPTFSAAHVFEALRRGRPTVLIVRPPVDAIESAIARGYPSAVVDAFREYEWMHERLLPVLDRVVVAPFDQVTERFGDVVAEVNARFGTALVPFPHDDPAARDAVSSTLSAHARAVTSEPAALAHIAPAMARRDRRRDARAALLHPVHDAIRARCESLYVECVAHSLGTIGARR